MLGRSEMQLNQMQQQSDEANANIAKENRQWGEHRTKPRTWTDGTAATSSSVTRFQARYLREIKHRQLLSFVSSTGSEFDLLFARSKEHWGNATQSIEAKVNLALQDNPQPPYFPDWIGSPINQNIATFVRVVTGRQDFAHKDMFDMLKSCDAVKNEQWSSLHKTIGEMRT
ncbi:hypothetical protein K491DRAFT_349957 [Lophiostoma macrostomum CBS 122681]|uniref:Uncharacterized protein n=1 Tax=Lophiostoma macrostomum CBS 122681 TaxID=1314788 RepID=A0A6A6TDX4_9PLEO|nr:hypothetical protein K491DRAFT_349957 [Lophiostoma macrostomum CBS 122681]